MTWQQSQILQFAVYFCQTTLVLFAKLALSFEKQTIYQLKFCTNYSGLILTAYGRLVHYLQARALLPPSGQLFINEVRYNIKGALAETGNLVYAEKGCRITEEHRICHVFHGSGLKEKVE